MQIVDSLHILWKPPLEKPTLTVDAIHVWCATLQRSASEIEELTAILSMEERSRASKFYFEHHQRRFIAARGLLRRLLADYLAINPKDVEFSYLERGKPQLAGDRALQFNVSHSEKMAVYAISQNYPVGIDVEWLRATPDIDQIASRFFTKGEYEELRSLPASDKTLAFFRCWTRKEAYLKALGDGIAGGLDKIEVSLTLEAEIRQIDGDKATNCWRLDNIIPATGYIGAIATRCPLGTIASQAPNLECWHLI